ncbi:hypothetical protein PSTT_07456 [Puccinia striiformis]|uniref:Uncharacterized protein n=1 Tax=Puccinia striiformis TaxID=27350 RepID=A0A2S4VGA0_9BASI|nr:hypothetical protein PSTT_07456 [Puccinia striiformis]
MDSHLAVVLVSSQLHRPPNLLQTILALQVTSVSLTFGHQAAKPSAPGSQTKCKPCGWWHSVNFWRRSIVSSFLPRVQLPLSSTFPAQNHFYGWPTPPVATQPVLIFSFASFVVVNHIWLK